MAGDQIRVCTTGFPRSGTTWLEAVLLGLAPVSAPSKEITPGLRLKLKALADAPVFRALLDETGVTLECAVEAMLSGAPVWSGGVAPKRSRVVEASLEIVPWLPAANLFERSRRPRVESSAASLAELMLEGGGGTPGAHVIVSKHLSPERIGQLLPGYRVVRIMRDLRDTFLSHLAFGFVRTPPSLLDRMVDDDGVRPDWAVELVRFAARKIRDDWVETHGEGDSLALRYEDVRCDGADAVERLTSSLGLSGDLGIQASLDAVRLESTPTEGTGGRIRDGRVGGWRSSISAAVWGATDGMLDRAVAQSGYEPDSAWVRGLPEASEASVMVPPVDVSSSALRVYRDLWATAPELRSRFPDYWGSDSKAWLEFLRTEGDERTQRWFRQMDLWASAVETGPPTFDGWLKS